MTITREVIYDLLPAYFAGEASADTRALIDEFLATDPEFARMTTKFQRLFEDRSAGTGVLAVERRRLEKARRRAEGRQISAGFAVAFTLAALFPLAMDLLRGQDFQARSLVIAIVFAGVAFASTIGWLAVRRPVS